MESFLRMGMNFVDPKGTYDASKYEGIAFYAKRGPDSTAAVRLKIPDRFTDPDGGRCSECFNDMGTDLRLTQEWKYYEIPFEKLRQVSGWGRPRRMNVNRSAPYGIQFQVSEASAEFDIWLDELRFLGGCAD